MKTKLKTLAMILIALTNAEATYAGSGTGGHGGHPLGAQLDADFRARLAKATKVPILRDLVPAILALYRDMPLSVVPAWEGSEVDRGVRIVEASGRSRIEISSALEPFSAGDDFWAKYSADPSQALFGLLARQVLSVPEKTREHEIVGAECFIQSPGNRIENRACDFLLKGYAYLKDAAQLGEQRYPVSSRIKEFLPAITKVRLRIVKEIAVPAGSPIDEAVSFPDQLLTVVSEKSLSSEMLSVHELLVLAGIDGNNAYYETANVMSRAKAGIPKCALPTSKKDKEQQVLFEFLSSLITVNEQIELGLTSPDWSVTVNNLNGVCFDRARTAAESQHIRCPDGAHCKWASGKDSGSNPYITGACLLHKGGISAKHWVSEKNFHMVVHNLRCTARYVLEKEVEHVPSPAEICAHINDTCRPQYVSNPNLISQDLVDLDALSASAGCR